MTHQNNVKDILQASLMRAMMYVLGMLPLELVSWLGGSIARTLGPYISVQHTALRNLELAFPDKPLRERKSIARSMWDNLGRTAFEFSHHAGMRLYNRVEIEGLEHLPQDGQPVIFVSGHIGNWELTYPMAKHNGVTVTLVYRHANNRSVDAMIADIRAHHSNAMLEKGPRGAVALARAIKQGRSLAMLIDQKMNEGIPIPFFGRDAMTAPAVAILALKYDLPIIPARIIRTHGAHFKGIIYPPLAYTKSGDTDADVRNVLTLLNRQLEDWIREYPEQWFWVHNRWPKE